MQSLVKLPKVQPFVLTKRKNCLLTVRIGVISEKKRDFELCCQYFGNWNFCCKPYPWETPLYDWHAIEIECSWTLLYKMNCAQINVFSNVKVFAKKGCRVPASVRFNAVTLKYCSRYSITRFQRLTLWATEGKRKWHEIRRFRVLITILLFIALESW